MPLTDLAGQNSFIQRHPDAVPVQGTVISSALQLCRTSLIQKEKSHKAIVLITDGERPWPGCGEGCKGIVWQGVIVLYRWYWHGRKAHLLPNRVQGRIRQIQMEKRSSANWVRKNWWILHRQQAAIIFILTMYWILQPSLAKNWIIDKKLIESGAKKRIFNLYAFLHWHCAADTDRWNFCAGEKEVNQERPG